MTIVFSQSAEAKHSGMKKIGFGLNTEADADCCKNQGLTAYIVELSILLIGYT